MTNPCAECTRRCCHHYVVTVTGYDVWVIANGLRLAPEQFLVTVPQKPSARTFRLDGSERMYDIALDKAKARTREKPCVFWLGLPGGGGRCGIYPYRPFVCQTYPAMLNGGDPLRREDVLCPGTAWREYCNRLFILAASFLAPIQWEAARFGLHSTRCYNPAGKVEMRKGEWM